MNLGLNGKNAIVCGASKGMGFAIAKKLAEEGANVVLLARRKPELLKACAEIKKVSTSRLIPVSIDLSKTRLISTAVKKIEKSLGPIHILINNVGGPTPGGFLDVSDSDWQKTFDQNLKSVITMTRAVVPGMKKQHFGRIINIASQLVKEPQSRMILSNTIRSGVVAFAKTISFELAADNITVNTLCPGAILTDRLVSLIEIRAKREKRPLKKVIEDVAKSVPMKRIGKPEEFANVAVFLASEKASYVTGTVIAIDGGITKSLM